MVSTDSRRIVLPYTGELWGDICVEAQNLILLLYVRCLMDSIIYVRIKELCAAKGITLAKLEEDTGLSSSIIRKWKNN